MNKLSDQWQTPQGLFDELNKEFNFDIDLCATEANSKCDTYCTDYLNNKYNHVKDPFHDSGIIVWNDRDNLRKANYSGYTYSKKDLTAFMNPPYSNPKPFIEKAWEDSKHCKIVCLVKCDPSTKWWSTFWEYEGMCIGCIGNVPEHDCMEYEVYIGPKPGCEVRFFPKRIQFDPPQQLINSGEVWLEPKQESVELWGDWHNEKTGLNKPKIEIKLKRKWVQKCRECGGDGNTLGSQDQHREDLKLLFKCPECKGKGYKELSGTTFSSALIIMDRRNLS